MTEFRKVADYLSSNKIKYELDVCADGWQIGVPQLPRHGDCDFDIIIHNGSYGHDQGLLEIMGDISDEPDGDVEGWLNGAEVIDRIERNFLNKKNK